MKKQIEIKGLVYHIKDPNDPSLNSGYIGVVNKTKGVYKRFRQHKTCKKNIMHHHIRVNNLTFENDVEIIFEGLIDECYAYENKLRPKKLMGWNLAPGGGGPYYSEIKNLSNFRSKTQKERMQNEELKKQQGETFKKNYYSNTESQKLRSKRAKEHMSDPNKRAACLKALHKKKKCPYCDFESNAGNLAKHIKSKHKESNE